MDHGSNSNHSSTGGNGKNFDIKEGHSVLSLFNLKPDRLRHSLQDYRLVSLCRRPAVRHRTNASFYAQCSTQKLDCCTWCRQLRRDNQKQGSMCLNSGKRLIVKYHRWYPELIHTITTIRKTHILYKQIFEKYDIICDDEKGNMLLKVWVSNTNFAVVPMHLKRTYTICIFACREFNTGALARKLSMFRADFHPLFEYLPDQRAAAQQMNACYFHVYHTNIDGGYDPQALTKERIIETFKYCCDEILRHTITNNPNGAPKIVKMSMQTIIQDTPRPIAYLNTVLIETMTNIGYTNLGCNKRTLPHGSIY